MKSDPFKHRVIECAWRAKRETWAGFRSVSE